MTKTKWKMKLTDKILEKKGFEFEEFPNPEWSDDNDNVIMEDENKYYILNERYSKSWIPIATELELINFITIHLP